jgi:hypothetical protein
MKSNLGYNEAVKKDIVFFVTSILLAVAVFAVAIYYRSGAF